MTCITRREFLRRLTATGLTTSGVLLLAACQQPATAIPTRIPEATAAPTIQPTAAPIMTATSTAAVTRQPAATALPQATQTAVVTVTPQTASYPDLVVVRGGKQPEELVNRALAALGGIERFVKPGNDVIIKPNICVAYHTYEYAATTNPWVVGALVRLCKSAGAARVRVMDSPFGGTPAQAYAISGIQDQVNAAGGAMEQMTARKFKKTDIPQGKDIKSWPIYEDILKADVVINVPIAKNHSLARLTLGMKNLMGAIQNRESIHVHMGQRLADLASRIKPALTIVDAVRILTANGPTGGNLADVKELDTLIASPDIVAADAFDASLFNMKPDQLDYIVAGVASGIGRSDLANLKIEQIAVGG